MILKREFRNIPRHYNLLISMTNQHYFVGIVNEWIVDNYYLILVMRGLIEVAYSKRENRKYLKESSFVNQAVLSILEKHNYKIDQKMLIKDLNKIQKENDYYFSYQELELLPVITHINLIKKINEIALKEADDIRIRKRVKRLIAVIKRNLKYKRETNFKWHFNLKDPLTKYEIVYLNEQLRDLNENSNKVFKELNTFLNENNILLRNVIEEVHIENVRRNITIANVFNSVNRVNDIEDEKTYDGLSKLERLFEKDSWFEKMDTQSKILYREKLVKYCKKKKLDPYVYLNKLINKGGHIGEYLFKEKNVRIRTYIYIFILSSITLVLSYFLSSLLTNYIILGTILLLIPVSEVVNYFLKKIYLLIYKAKPLFKLDFNRGVPKEYKTMIVIPTIVKDAKKVRKVFEKLESFYLCNKSNNLYFTLLADCSESKTEHCEHDKEVVKEGLKVSFLLNKKYGKDIFYFVYRNRKFNKGENSWLGFERKRGALLDFNDLIMGNLSSEEIEDKFNINTFKKFKEKIKYVITLDVDTNLFLNSALKLIGTMAHPMNVAHLNKQKNVVTKGYGMLQPKICVDIDSTNKSMFSQIYAGIGGFDPYSNFFPDFYQDVFDEGHFVGKGIYDLEIFQHVLKNRFPNNLILSHDLIEGSYLKCGNVLDIELIDDFPSKFLVDATRRSRWARGDFQIINWVRKNVRNVKNERVKNPISPLARFKILSNITRGLLEFNLLLIIFLSFIINKVSPVYSLLFVLFVGLIPTFSYIREKLMFKDFSLTTIKYYNVISTGGKALLLRTISFFANIPYNAKLYLTSFSKSFFRMFISKKKLLNWMTAEEAEKVVKTTFKNHIKNFKFNYISAILLMILVIKFGKYIYIGIFISLLFLFAPILAYLLSGDIKKIGAKDCEEDNKKVLEIAKKTWKFFEDNLTHETNYLIPDNYQLNREVKEDIKTSPTNIGLSLVSVVSAYELKLISKQEMIRLVKKIIATIKKLDKWFGHLYNWYNIKTLKVMYPHFLSSVDSGNFVASLIVAKEALVKLNLKTVKPIISDINKLIDETDFSKLYSESGLFSIGYNVDEGKLLPYNYNKFMSESRITSFVAIAKGDVPSKHWLYLDKTLTKYKHKKGLASWSGTAFEYFMPIIFMRSYPNTLLDESYYFAFYVQKEFMKRLNLDYPWGISESAYNELDDANSYKYGAFGIPYLRFRNEPISRVVISPYSSVLAITEFPEDVIKNLKGLLDLNMLGDYGFYDAYDITDKTPVYSYYAHHQGMILSSITNYLKNGIIQDYFEADKNIRAFIALSKERVQLKPSINYQIIKYKKYTYDKESFINDIRVFRHLSTLPEISILSNSKYSLMINDRGNSYSRYRNIQINRYRKVTEQDYGMFLYIRDKKSNKVWSNTFAPVNKTPDNYEVVFALDRIKFIRLDEKIITKTEIVVTKTHHAEIRKVTFKNLSNKTRFLELTTYNEPILFENANDISHPAFAKLFISTEYDSETNTIIAMRKLRDSDTKYYMANRLIIENPTDKYQYETNRMEFIVEIKH